LKEGEEKGERGRGWWAGEGARGTFEWARVVLQGGSKGMVVVPTFGRLLPLVVEPVVAASPSEQRDLCHNTPANTHHPTPLIMGGLHCHGAINLTSHTADTSHSTLFPSLRCAGVMSCRLLRRLVVLLWPSLMLRPSHGTLLTGCPSQGAHWMHWRHHHRSLRSGHQWWVSPTHRGPLCVVCGVACGMVWGNCLAAAYEGRGVLGLGFRV